MEYGAGGGQIRGNVSVVAKGHDADRPLQTRHKVPILDPVLACPLMMPSRFRIAAISMDEDQTAQGVNS